MNNLECVVAVLEKHREARQWADLAVAGDLLTQLGVDPAADVLVPGSEPAPVETKGNGRGAKDKAAGADTSAGGTV